MTGDGWQQSMPPKAGFDPATCKHERARPIGKSQVLSCKCGCIKMPETPGSGSTSMGAVAGWNAEQGKKKG